MFIIVVMSEVCTRFMAAWLMGRPESRWADGSGDGGSSIGLSERSEEKTGRAANRGKGFKHLRKRK